MSASRALHGVISAIAVVHRLDVTLVGRASMAAALEASGVARVDLV
jgi:hypothetical protein